MFTQQPTGYNKKKYRFSKIVKVKNPYAEFYLDKKLSPQFERIIEKLTIEELIALKLYLSTKLLNGKFRLSCFLEINDIVSMSILLYTMMNYSTMQEWADFLGIEQRVLVRKLNDLDLTKYAYWFMNGKPKIEEEENKLIDIDDFLKKFSENK